MRSEGPDRLAPESVPKQADY